MFTLPDLGYDFDGLEPYIDAKTMEIHHDKHHAAYVEKLNAALEGHSDVQAKPIEELLSDMSSLPEAARTAVQNNGGGHANHSMFWKIMTPGGAKQPEGDLANAINTAFGSGDQFKAKLTEAAVGRFGSGWAWLVKKGDKLEVYSTANQDSPLMEGNQPIMGVDVWEHAYYLKYQNKRPDYLEAWWNTINWDEVAARFKNA